MKLASSFIESDFYADHTTNIDKENFEYFPLIYFEVELRREFENYQKTRDCFTEEEFNQIVIEYERLSSHVQRGSVFDDQLYRPYFDGNGNEVFSDDLGSVLCAG